MTNISLTNISFAHISATEVTGYAKLHKLSEMDAYRDLFSQKLFDCIARNEVDVVLKEIVRQLIGNGRRDLKHEPKTMITDKVYPQITGGTEP